MGKTRREIKIARRDYEKAVKDSGKNTFSWKKYFGVLGRTLPKVLLVFVATLALQILLSVVLKIQFFGTVYGQLMLFIPAYIATMIWTRQSASQMFNNVPPKPDILKRR
jgi:ABC-type sugar transport system permease subunit